MKFIERLFDRFFCLFGIHKPVCLKGDYIFFRIKHPIGYWYCEYCKKDLSREFLNEKQEIL